MAKKPITFTVLDSSVTTYGFRIIPEGVDLEHFKKNPVMLYDHSDWRMPIGRWENIRLEDGKILADAVFDYDDPNEEVQRIIGKVERGFIKAASVGLRDNVMSTDTALQIQGQTLPTVIKSRLREASIVNIGGNHNAIRLYDEEDAEIDLNDEIKLSDLFKPKIIDNQMNKELLEALNLADGANESAALAAIIALKDSFKTLTDSNAALQKKIDGLELADKEAKTAKAIKLVDEAIRVGKINADADGKVRQSYLDLFDENFDRATNILAGLPARKSVSQQINTTGSGSSVELTDLLAKDWDELDRSDKLITLRDADPEAYKQKYKQKFGVEPKI